MKRKRVWLIMLSVIVLVIIIYCVVTGNPALIIQRKLGLVLPESSKIVECTYDRCRGFFEAQVRIDEKDIAKVKEALMGYYGGEWELDLNRTEPNYMPKWWNPSANQVESSFFALEGGPAYFPWDVMMTAKIMVIITKAEDGLYYLYLDFAILPRDVLFGSSQADEER